MNGWVYGCMNAWMHGCMDAWRNGGAICGGEMDQSMGKMVIGERGEGQVEGDQGCGRVCRRV